MKRKQRPRLKANSKSEVTALINVEDPTCWTLQLSGIGDKDGHYLGLDLRDAKRLHAWLGRAIEWLSEQKQRGER